MKLFGAPVQAKLDTEETKHSPGNGRLTFSFLFLHAFSSPVDGGHLRLEGEVVVPDVLQLFLKERDPLQTVHLLQVR